MYKSGLGEEIFLKDQSTWLGWPDSSAQVELDLTRALEWDYIWASEHDRHNVENFLKLTRAGQPARALGHRWSRHVSLPGTLSKVKSTWLLLLSSFLAYLVIVDASSSIPLCLGLYKHSPNMLLSHEMRQGMKWKSIQGREIHDLRKLANKATLLKKKP